MIIDVMYMDIGPVTSLISWKGDGTINKFYWISIQELDKARQFTCVIKYCCTEECSYLISQHIFHPQSLFGASTPT
jgi:hypothetical protein